MKKTLLILGLFSLLPACARAEAENLRQTLFSWGELGTLAGATAATMLIVQFIKQPLDRIRKIPTRLVVLLVSFVILLCAHIFTTGLSPDALPLIALNSFLVATASMGVYEIGRSGRAAAA